MAGIVDKFKRMWDAPDDEYEYDEYGYADEGEEEYEEPAPRERERERQRQTAPAPKNKVVNINATAKLQVGIFKPERFGEETRSIADDLMKTHTVVLNLEGLDVDIAQRIIDFTSGSCYAVQGNVMKISHYIFVITPSSVDISGDISIPTGAEQDGSAALDMPFTGR